MADIDTNNGIMEVASHEGELDISEGSVHVINGNIVEQGDVCEEDLLQQAFVEASSFPDGVQIQYSGDSVGLQEASIIHTSDETPTYITADSNGQVTTVQLAEHFENGSYQVLDTVDATNDEGFTAESIPMSNGTAADITDSSSHFINITDDKSLIKTEIKTDDSVIDEGQISEVIDCEVPDDSENIETKQIQIQLASGTSGVAPLGSSLNPIRIIQQGNQYTPVQQLSTEQLQQIMQVVQQQQITKSLDTGSSILYNQQTNTRIVYRVIYPSDLHKDGSGEIRIKAQPTVVQTIPKRAYKKRTRDEEQEKIDGPELTKEEKEARKKVRAKTRSGRISKPPKHMVKDYKQLHVLDYDDDYDDSDGGYSDYKVGEAAEKGAGNRQDEETTYISLGLNSIKPKNWKCVSCDKAYIGRAGLGRHLKLNPSHGSLDPEGEGDMEPPPPGTVIVPTTTEESCSTSIPSLTPNIPSVTPNIPSVTPNGLNSTANSTASLSEDSRDSTYSLPYTPTPRPRGQRGRPRGSRSSSRGRGAYSRLDQEAKRRNKLKEITRECSDEELMEIVLPRLAKVITLWEFLLMKVEIGDPATPHADDIFREYEKLHHHVKKLCQEYLQFVPEAEAKNDSQSCLQIENDILAQALGLKVGCHKVKDIPETETAITYKYKFLTTNHIKAETEYNNKSFLKRTVEVVSPEDIVSPKKLKMSPMKSTGTVLPSHSYAQSNGGTLKPTSILTSSLTAAPKSSASARIVKLISPVATLANGAGGTSNVSTTGVILTNSLPQNPVIIQTPSQVIAGMNPGLALGASSGRKTAVSLLNNSTKLLSPKQETQKFLILSGSNTSSPLNVSVPVSSVASVVDSVARTRTMAAGIQQTVVQQQSSSSSAASSSSLSSLQSDPSTNPFSSQSVISSNALILTSSNSTGPATATVGQTLLPMHSAASTQPILISIPQSSQQTLLPTKIIVSDRATSQVNNLEPIITEDTDTPINTDNPSEDMLDTDQVLNTVDNEASFITDDTSYNLSSDGRDDTSALDSENVVYALPNGDTDDYSVTVDDTSQTNIVYAVDPGMVLVDKSETDNVSITTADLDQTADNTKNLLSKHAEEVIGVLDSIDTTETIASDKMSTLEDAQPDTGETVQILEQPQMAATENELDPDPDPDPDLSQYQSQLQESTDQSESEQMSATIYQTEDGLFIIQNSDGSTLQLQGSDGQSLSMETVQALLAMDGGAEFITEQNDVT